MPPLMQLPGYQIQNALLDFAPLNQGIDAYRQGQKDVRRAETAQNAGNALMAGDYKGAMGTALAGDRADIAGVAMQARAADSHEQDAALKRQYTQIDRMGRIAAAAADDPNPANRQKAHAWLISQHPGKDKLDPMYLDPNTGLKMLAAEAGQYKSELEKKMEAAKLGLIYAQTGRYNAQSEAQRALANVRDGRAGQPEAPDPLNGWGQDEAGNIVPPKGPAISRRPGTATAPDTLPDDVAPQIMPQSMGEGASRFSPRAPISSIGRKADEVPGIVVDSKGKPSEFASRTAAGQDAMQAQPVDDQQRLRKYYQTQQMWTQVHGKAPAGYAYNDKGGLEDLKNKTTATERASRMHAESGMKTLDSAIALLGKSGTLEQLAGDTYQVPGTSMKVGGFGEAGRGFRSAESAVLQLNFALSGKSVSNAEREHFMRIYMPTSFDSKETQAFKLGKIKEFFSTVLEARKRGMDDDKLAELYRQKLSEGIVGPEQTEKKVDPVKQRLYNKYGLE